MAFPYPPYPHIIALAPPSFMEQEVKNSYLWSELLLKEKAMGALPSPLSIHPQPKAGAFWLFPVT
ncbi:MAG: hypothetical protein P8Y80_04430 [Acidobacteriota bacterium]